MSKNRYKCYVREQEKWKNINSDNKEKISNLLFNLYNNISNMQNLDYTATYEEKQQDAQNKLSELGIFMIDSDSISFLASENNKTYSFINSEKNPFLVTPEQCESICKINDSELLVETKARVADAENNVAKICKAHIKTILDDQIKQEIGDKFSEKDCIDIYIKKINEYEKIYNLLSKVNIKYNQEYQGYLSLFNEYGNINKSEFMKCLMNEEKDNLGKKFLKELAKDNNVNTDIDNIKKVLVARQVMSKMYQNKEYEITDIVREYDLIKDSEDGKNVYITVCNDKNTKNWNKRVNIYFKAYNQPFSMHMHEGVLNKIENKFGVIDKEKYSNNRNRSLVTRKIGNDTKSIVSAVYRNDSSIETINFLQKFEDMQDIEKMKEKAYAKNIAKARKEEYQVEEKPVISSFRTRISKVLKEESIQKAIKIRRMINEISKKQKILNNDNIKISNLKKQYKVIKEQKQEKEQVRI